MQCIVPTVGESVMFIERVTTQSRVSVSYVIGFVTIPSPMSYILSI